VTLLRRSLMQLEPKQAMESLIQQLARYDTNAAFLAKVNTFVR
jgi:transcription termination factor Rho